MKKMKKKPNALAQNKKWGKINKFTDTNPTIKLDVNLGIY